MHAFSDNGTNVLIPRKQDMEIQKLHFVLIPIIKKLEQGLNISTQAMYM